MESTLTDILGRPLLPFTIEGKTLYVRQPTAEEYDDAEGLRNRVYARVMQEPDVQALADKPCSAGERKMLELLITQNEERLAAADEETRERLTEEIARLRDTIETRTLAEEQAWDRAILARDRWLTMHLLSKKDGKPVFNVKSGDFQRKWETMPMKVKDVARGVIWQALALVRDAPFSWED